MSQFNYLDQHFILRENFNTRIRMRMSVIPVIEEEPCVPWQQYQKIVPTQEIVAEWFEKYSPTGIAVLTGRFSNRIVLDIEKGEDISRLGIPTDGPICEAGNGNTQYWFTHPQTGYVPTVNLEALMGIKGILRADDSYVIAPNSRLASGAEYKWNTDNRYVRIKKLPASFLKRLNSLIQEKKTLNLFSM